MTKIRNNSILNRFGKLIIGILGIFAMLSAFLSAFCPLINPAKFVWTAFFGLGFWIIFFVNIIILFILIFLKSKRTLFIPIIALLISLPGLTKSLSFKKNINDNAELSVMTFNVSVFRDYKVKSRSISDVKKIISQIVNEHNPHVLCLQESGSWPNNSLSDFAKTIDYKYFISDKRNGNTVLSKFPISGIEINQEMKQFSDMYKITTDKDKSFYLINCHFNSFGISKQEIQYINDTKNIVKDSDIYAKSLIAKLTNGFKIRAVSINNILENIPNDNSPMIICGDFNDTPLSYTYNQMILNGFYDAFITNSRGIGKTYCGPLPLLRIDYFWYNDNIQVVDFKRIKKTTSDHYPLLMTFNIKENNEL